MQISRNLRFLALAAAATFSACGGGEGPQNGVMHFAGRMQAYATDTAVDGTRTLSAAGAAASATQDSATPELVLDWAEYRYSDLFPKALAVKYPEIVYGGVTYAARSYTGPWGTRYLGITPDGRIFGLGDFTNDALQPFDTVEYWSALVTAERCAVYPGNCGKFVSEIRYSGLSPAYASNPDYKVLVDTNLDLISTLVGSVTSSILWPADIPLKFSGCGYLGAFMLNADTPVSAYEVLRFSLNQPTANVAPNFGPDFSNKNMSVMCHELMEKALDVFYLNLPGDPALLAEYERYFVSGNPATRGEEIVTAAVFSSAIFQSQVLFHEFGHAVDKLLLLDDAIRSKKGRTNFLYPLANACGVPGCDTISEDFSDWFSTYVLAEELKKDAKSSSPTQVKWFVGAMKISTLKWQDILGAGGGAAHGYTRNRQANMACYLYGSSAAVRAADAGTGGGLLGEMQKVDVGFTSDYCVQVYNINAASTQRLVGQYLKF